VTGIGLAAFIIYAAAVSGALVGLVIVAAIVGAVIWIAKGVKGTAK
jgi:hypothetical protein